MDIAEFLKFTEEVCSDFIKNSNLSSVVLYGGSYAMLNFFAEAMKNNLISKRKNIEITIDEKIGREHVREKYSQRYLIDVDSLLQCYSKSNILQKSI